MDRKESGQGFWRIILLAAVILPLAGCATRIPQSPSAQLLSPPPSEAIRAQLGTIGLLSASPTNNLSIPKSMTRAAGAGQGAVQGGLSGLTAGVDAGGPEALLLWPVVIPAGLIIGAIVGQASGEAEKTINQNDKILHAAISGQEIQDLFVAELLRNARGKAGRQLLLLPVEKSPTPAGTTNFQRFADCGVDTVMEIGIQNAGLHAYEGTEKLAPMTAFIQVRVRLVRVRDSTELYAQTWLRTGDECPLSEWVESNGRPLRQELAGMTSPFAENIIEELFLVYEPRKKITGSPGN